MNISHVGLAFAHSIAMEWHDWLLTTIAFTSEVIGTVSGFGSSTFLVPAALYLETFQFVLALTAILHVLSNAMKLVYFRGHMNIGNCIPLALISIFFTGIGAALISFVSVTALQFFLGGALMLVASSHIFLRYTASKALSMPLTALSGFFTGLVGTGGALRGIALQSLRLDKSAFVFASSFIDFSGDAVRTGIYLRNGYMDWNQWYYIPMLALAAVLGPWCGRWILVRINQNTFERVVTAMILLSGLSLVVEGIFR